MEVCTLASSSSGNCILVTSDRGSVLVDAGISCRRISAALKDWGLTPADLAGILITHEHADHIAGLATLIKYYHIPIYTSPGTADALCSQLLGAAGLLHILESGKCFDLGPFTVEPFPTSHDAAEPMGYVLSQDGKKAAVVTDLGYVSDDVLDGVLGCDLLICEANHDVPRLLSGPYPQFLKQRILGDKGHLSNEAGAALAVKCVQAGTKTVILAHLSPENNTPDLALTAVGAALRAAGFDPEKDLTLAAAPRSRPSQVFSV